MEYSVDKIGKTGEFTPENGAHDRERQTPGKRELRNDDGDTVTISPEARKRSASVPAEEPVPGE
jgi:hypothetical protein